MKAAFFTLGCKVNHYETAAMEELFLKAGHEVVPFESPADVYIVNTCTVTMTADKKSRQMIARAHALSPLAPVIAVGCYSEVARDKVETLPGVAAVLGTAQRQKIVEIAENAVLGQSMEPEPLSPFQRREFETLSAVADSRTRATLKVQDGCVQFCTYCAIPFARGALKSRSLESCRREFLALAKGGYKEVVLAGIQLSAYGKDLKEGTDLVSLIRLADEYGLPRLRLGSLDPNLIDERFCQAAAESKSLCRQFHLALQSGSDTVLARMNRPYTAEQYRREAAMLRAAMSDCSLTTDIIAGFPGETEQEHCQTMEFVKEMAFARIHVFPYSRRPGTKADSMPGQLTRREKEARARELIALGDTMEAAFIDGLKGTVHQVLMEENGEGYTGNYVRVRCGTASGELASVRIVGRENKTAIGEVLQ